MFYCVCIFRDHHDYESSPIYVIKNDSLNAQELCAVSSIFFYIHLFIAGLMEDQEGVGVRGSRSCGHGLRLYRLSDVEEDDDMPRLPHSSHVYTYVNRYF